MTIKLNQVVVGVLVGVLLGYALARALFPQPDDALARPLSQAEHEAHGNVAIFPQELRKDKGA